MTRLFLLLSAAALQTADWRLKDQFGREHAAADLRGHAVFIVGGDRAARNAMEPWIRAVAGAVDSTTGGRHTYRVVRVADLRSVPRLMRGMALSYAPRDTAQPLLLDFSGEIARRYGFTPGVANQVVLGRDGSVLYRGAAQTPGPARVDSIAVALRRAAAATSRP